ncbi:hypothetical protein WN51_11117 [Melipona quadrifasciata]|uniref:Uncharacterized protein n=1 Tax=Melipona quadrifasciata TaxID=166423 RepID=A0A0M9A407_9HYME|nr:hypothetical protein WN51_11117 [Melipona quadrifasciata]
MTNLQFAAVTFNKSLRVTNESTQSPNNRGLLILLQAEYLFKKNPEGKMFEPEHTSAMSSILDVIDKYGSFVLPEEEVSDRMLEFLKGEGEKSESEGMTESSELDACSGKTCVTPCFAYDDVDACEGREETERTKQQVRFDIDYKKKKKKKKGTNTYTCIEAYALPGARSGICRTGQTLPVEHPSLDDADLKAPSLTLMCNILDAACVHPLPRVRSFCPLDRFIPKPGYNSEKMNDLYRIWNPVCQSNIEAAITLVFSRGRTAMADIGNDTTPPDFSAMGAANQAVHVAFRALESDEFRGEVVAMDGPLAAVANRAQLPLFFQKNGYSRYMTTSVCVVRKKSIALLNTLGVSGGETMPETTDNRRVIVEGKDTYASDLELECKWNKVTKSVGIYSMIINQLKRLGNIGRSMSTVGVILALLQEVSILNDHIFIKWIIQDITVKGTIMQTIVQNKGEKRRFEKHSIKWRQKKNRTASFRRVNLQDYEKCCPVILMKAISNFQQQKYAKVRNLAFRSATKCENIFGKGEVKIGKDRVTSRTRPNNAYKCHQYNNSICIGLG